jgi:hypothetical protein
VGVHLILDVIDGLNSLEYDRAVPVQLAQERETIPQAEEARVSFLQPPNASRERLTRLLVARGTRVERVHVERECGPAAKGRYVVSRLCGRRPSENVSSVTTSTVNPAALAWRRADSVTSLLGSLFVRVSDGGEMKWEGIIPFLPAVICLERNTLHMLYT